MTAYSKPLHGRVSLRVSGQTYTLVYDMNAICAFEERAGMGFSQAISALDANGFSFSTVRLLGWAGLQREHGLSLEEAGEVIGSAGLQSFLEALGRAIEAALPRDDADEEAKPAAPKPRGKGSSAKAG